MVTAAAAEIGMPRGVWIGAAVAGGIAFVAAIGLAIAERGGISTWRQSARSVEVVVASVALVFLLAVGVAIATRADSAPSRDVVIVCIDSSASTADAREAYLADLKGLLLRAAFAEKRFYAADCGANVTGEVSWPVRRQFGGGEDYDSALARMMATREAEEVFFGGIEPLVRATADIGRLSLGEALAVMARQCRQAGGNCALYLFTDGEWNDALVRLRDGIGPKEERRYLRAHLPQLQDLRGSQVNFVGVGLGTSIGEPRLYEARELAEHLVERAGGTMYTWTARL